ncbi:hypothetical protein J2X53_004495 [Pseudorhodobacter sp. 4114]|nr:hypothetical protein [Pseudorhodobacter sp. 4114]
MFALREHRLASVFIKVGLECLSAFHRECPLCGGTDGHFIHEALNIGIGA